MTRRLFTRLLAAGVLIAGIAHGAAARSGKPTIVLVHGAFADGFGCRRVIPMLEHDGCSVIPVQKPLTSLTTDVETTKRVIDAQAGPAVVVGHSYDGAVITAAAAAAANINVKPLVYIAAFAPEGWPAQPELFASELRAAFRPLR
jgi:pimeloyl-ACP methyl ester carboxylesterase